VGHCSTRLRLFWDLWYFFRMIVVFSLMIPVLYFYVFSAFPAETTHREGFAFLVGAGFAVLGAVVSSWLFSFLPYESLSPLLVYIITFLRESLIPYIFIPLLCLAVFKGRFPEKIGMVVSMTFGSAVIFLPYIMFTRYWGPDLWASAMVPLLVLSYLFVLDMVWRKLISRRCADFMDLFPEALIPIALFLVMDGVKTLWYYGYPAWIYWIVSLCILGSALFIRLYKYFR